MRTSISKNFSVFFDVKEIYNSFTLQRRTAVLFPCYVKILRNIFRVYKLQYSIVTVITNIPESR